MNRNYKSLKKNFETHLSYESVSTIYIYNEILNVLNFKKSFCSTIVERLCGVIHDYYLRKTGQN